ncbi:MAG: hypothetical protein P1V51_02445 [Deltaproteobacteria bacterium]|nr:hypothetical protein [Deltaproteobacteria bacterium]
MIGGWLLLASALPLPAAGTEPILPPAEPDPFDTRPVEAVERSETVDGREVAAPPPREVDPVWHLYDQAFATLMGGEKQEALRLLARIRDRHPDHPAALLAGDLLAVYVVDPADPRNGALPVTTRTELRSRLLEREQPDGRARAELAVVQTLHGIGIGIELCFIAQCWNTRAVAGALTLGGSLGLVLSLTLTSGGVTAAQASASNSGAAWGFWNGLAILGGAGLLGWPAGPENLGIPVVLQLGWLAVGAIVTRHVPVHAGQISLANSAGIWSGVLVLLLHGVTWWEADPALIWWTLLAASDLGLVAGAVLGTVFPISRTRALLIDAGGLLGMLLGMGGAAIIFGDRLELPVFSAMAAGGTVAGLLTGYLLTDTWDYRGVKPEVALLPLRDGAAIVLGGRF